MAKITVELDDASFAAIVDAYWWLYGQGGVEDTPENRLAHCGDAIRMSIASDVAKYVRERDVAEAHKLASIKSEHVQQRAFESLRISVVEGVADDGVSKLTADPS